MTTLRTNLDAIQASDIYMDYPGGRQAFQLDLYKHHGIDLATKGYRADVAFNIAWDQQHSDGYGAVADMFGDLAQLI